MDDPTPAPAPAPAAPAPAPVAAPAPTPAPVDSAAVARVTRWYWLATEQSVPGMTDYDIDLFINSKWVRKLHNGEDQDVFKVIIGEGNEGGAT